MLNDRLKLFIQILAITSLAALSEYVFAQEINSEGRMPNVVIILTYDLGYGDVSCLNPDSKIKTPRLDELAREGILFTDAYAPSALCSPTRYALLTGRYAWRGVIKAGVLKPWDDPAIEQGRLTLPRMLKEKGYHTACIGK